MKRKKKAFQRIVASLVLLLCSACGTSKETMRVPGKYLLSGNLSEETDASGFAYYINDDEAYVARGSNTSLTPSIPSSVTIGGSTYQVTGVYHNGFAGSNITSITLPLSITTIDYQAFAGSSLTVAVIPCNVSAIGNGAYMNCFDLSAVQFKNDESNDSINIAVCGVGGSSSGETTGSSHLEDIPDYCFFNDTSLSTVSLPRSLKRVKSCAFECCISLKKMAFLSGFTTLEKYAFESCSSLEDVYFPSSFTNASTNTSNCDPGAFYRVNPNCIVHLSSTSSTYYDYWANSTAWRRYSDAGANLTLANRENSDIGLGNDYLYRVEDGEATVFSYAPSSFPASGVVVMPNSIDGYKVGKAEATTYSSYKTQVTQMYLSNNLKSIEDNFFVGFTSLTSISTTGDGCYTPKDNAIDLSGMSRLTEIGSFLFCTNTGGANLATYMGNTFYGTIILPKSLETIGQGAFCNLKKARGIVISATTPDLSQLTSIGDYAFYNLGVSIITDSWGDDSSLSFFDLTLPSTCVDIGEHAFDTCIGLRKLVFLGAAGKSLAIKQYAFAACRSLCEIVFPKEDASVTIANQAFYKCSAGQNRGFIDIAGIQEVYFPACVTSIGNMAFGCNERACFYFEAASKPSGVHQNFNQVVYDHADGTDDNAINCREEGSYLGYREHSPVYYGVGYYDGSSSSKRRYIQTDDFGFVETAIGSGKFICARYRFQPKSLANNAKVTVTVPEYIKYKASGANAYDGEAGANSDFQVISIGDSCFSASYSRKGRYLSVVNVPHAIKRIGDNAFARSVRFYRLNSYTGNTSNTNVFPSSLKYIGRCAFILTRLQKALSIPGDVVTFDMIDPSDLATQTMPVNMAAIDNSTPKMYTTSEMEPRRYATIFGYDWFLNEVSFTSVSNPNFAVDSSMGAIYRLRKISSSGGISDDIQLLMVMGRLSFSDPYSETSEAKSTSISVANVTLGSESNPFMSGMTSIHYGAFKIATWCKGLSLDTSVDIFPKRWNSSAVLPQNLFLGPVEAKTFCNIGHANNDTGYWVACESLSFKSSSGDFLMPQAVARCCLNLTAMEIPKNLTSIANNAFDRAGYITSWTTPNNSDVPTVGGEEGGVGTFDMRNNTSLLTIGASAFWGNHGMTKLYLPPNVTSIGDKAWSNSGNAAGLLTYVDMSLSTQLTSLGTDLFNNSTALSTVILAPNLQTIGEKAFYGCQISSLTWPTGDTLTSIGKNAFYDNRIEVLEIPDSVETIADSAFQNGSATKILRLPTALSDIKANSFSNNSSLNQVYVSNARTGKNDKSLAMRDGTFGPNVKYAILPNSAKFDAMPFKTCKDLQAVFYGRKYADISSSETSKNLAKYSNGSLTAPLYYYTDSSADMTSSGALYWRYKPGSTTTVQVMSYPSYSVSAEYDFSTFLA
ncbi:MAG: leucine-rich repeat protein [Bacilli bacterium]|nr:leucine-rich repeat protein [Bacilli bacterium]